LATDLDEPAVVLVNNFSDGWSKWLQDNSDVAGVPRDYRPIATINDIEIRTKAHSATFIRLPSDAAMSRKSYQSKSYQRQSRCTLSGSLNRCSVL
jgi:hypothetical protein